MTRTRVAVLLALTACASHAPAPSAPVRTEVAAAETAEKARKHDEARKHYQAAIASAKDPASIAFARREFADTLISWGEYPEAIAQLEGAAAANGKDASLWHDLGLLYHNAGDDQRAIASLEKSRALAPDDPRPRVTLGVLRWQRGDLAGARSEYEGLLALQLPERLREKAEWAVKELTKLLAERAPPASP